MFKSNGISLCPEDLSWEGWRKALGTTFDVFYLHGWWPEIGAFVESSEGRRFARGLSEKGVTLEFMIHLCTHLLPRPLFDAHPEYFRMDEAGVRTPDGNFCPSNENALNLIGKNLEPIVSVLKPTSARYHIWADDVKPWCMCPACRKLSWPNQNLIYCNSLARALAQIDPDAQVSYLAYKPALGVPEKIKPESNVFLEYAPVDRSYEFALSDESCEINKTHLEDLKKLAAFFGPDNSQVLEYWVDVSMFSKWITPRKKLVFSENVLRADLELYSALGFQHLSTFGVWHDEKYVEQFGREDFDKFLEISAEFVA